MQQTCTHQPPLYRHTHTGYLSHVQPGRSPHTRRTDARIAFRDHTHTHVPTFSPASARKLHTMTSTHTHTHTHTHIDTSQSTAQHRLLCDTTDQATNRRGSSSGEEQERAHQRRIATHVGRFSTPFPRWCLQSSTVCLEGGPLRPHATGCWWEAALPLKMWDSTTPYAPLDPQHTQQNACAKGVTQRHLLLSLSLCVCVCLSLSQCHCLSH